MSVAVDHVTEVSDSGNGGDGADGAVGCDGGGDALATITNAAAVFVLVEADSQR